MYSRPITLHCSFSNWPPLCHKLVGIQPGHILSRIYNCTEPKIWTSPFWKKLASPKISDDLFWSFIHYDVFLVSYKYKSRTAHQNFLWPLLVIPSKFVNFHPLFLTILHLQSYNYNCTIHLLQLQITFFNCRNCDQLHVKICPAASNWAYACAKTRRPLLSWLIHQLCADPFCPVCPQ